MSALSSLLSIAPKQLFLIDGIGAILSTLLLGIVLVRLKSVIGLPSAPLYILAGVAIILAIYSISCFLFSNDNNKALLIIIGIANLIYCTFTIFLLLRHSEVITSIGVFYFVSELMIVTGLAIWELRVAFYKNEKL